MNRRSFFAKALAFIGIGAVIPEVRAEEGKMEFVEFPVQLPKASPLLGWGVNPISMGEIENAQQESFKLGQMPKMKIVFGEK